MTIGSVRVGEEGEVEGERGVKVMEYLDAAFI